jgi:hypothetical protein
LTPPLALAISKHETPKRALSLLYRYGDERDTGLPVRAEAEYQRYSKLAENGQQLHRMPLNPYAMKFSG